MPDALAPGEVDWTVVASHPQGEVPARNGPFGLTPEGDAPDRIVRYGFG